MTKILFAALLMLSLLLSACGGTQADIDESIGDSPMPKTKMQALLASSSPDADNHYRGIAELAVSDLIHNFWQGDAQTGYLRPTWQGLPEDLADERGAIWEAAEVLFNIYDMWVLTGDKSYKDYMIAEANYFKTAFEAEDLEEAGALLHTASDDCAWHAMLYLNFHTVTGDEWFVERAINLLDNAYARWHDDAIGGGLWYRDDSDAKSLYEAGIALDWLRIWEITGEQRFYDLALESYEWLHTALGRDDGLYFCETTEVGPRGEFTPDAINEAGSCSFLGGNMCMAALSAKFYEITGAQAYLDRVYATNAGILRYYNRNGVLLNDRDAWTNGTFTSFYVSEVLSLPDTQEMQELLQATADSIAQNARTADGYYGGSWQGPADGAGSVWASGGSIPQQTMTSGSTVAILVGAALLEAGIDDYVR